MTETLEPRRVLAAAPIISEFMARNTSTVQDEDGDFSDWIEVLNSGDQPADMAGYWLTDRQDDLTAWRFPAVTLEPGETILVYASRKDRDEPDGELHTNFRLDGDGSYLALVNPDGTTIVHEFKPGYPPQVEDVSYGVSPDVLGKTLLSPGAPARYTIPVDDSLDADWNHVEFDDATWPVGVTGIGYETGAVEEPSMVSAIKRLNPSGYWRFEETGIATAAKNTGIVGLPLEGTYTGGPNRNASGPGSADPLYGFDDTNSAVALDGSDDAVTTTKSIMSGLGSFSMVGMIRPGQQTSDGIGLFGQNDAVEFGFSDPSTLRIWTSNGGLLSVDYTLPLDEWHHVAVVGDGQSLKIYLDGELAGQGGTATSDYGSSSSPFNIGGAGILDGTGDHFLGAVDEVAVFDRALTEEEIGSMLGGQTDVTNLSDLIATDIQAQMFGKSSTLYVRIPFQVDDPRAFSRLVLRMQYDDGFVAYVNGTEVTRELAPGEDEALPYDATATNSRPDSQVIVPRDIDISETRDGLKAGENILSLHVLNRSADDPDLLILPQLFAATSSVDLSRLGYMTTPSPGADNNPISEDLGPIVVDSDYGPNEPGASDPIVVTAQVAPSLRDVASVELVYRVMYAEESTTAMRDDGVGGDAIAGDGIYTGTVPGDIAQPGEMIRWYVLANDTSQFSGRLPKFEVTSGRDRTPEYFGTMVADPNVTSQIAILNWWVENERSAGSRRGTDASLYFNGEFYDSVFVRQRGGSTANNPVGKTNFKFDFVQEQFRFDTNEARVEEFNLNSTASDKAYIRQSLAFETYAAVGVAASISFPMHVRRNNEFYGVFVFIEEPDDEMLDRNGLDDNGALYKMGNSFTSATSSTRKKTRQDEDRSDLATFIADVGALQGEALHNYLLDNVDLPATLNYLVATVLTHQNDNPHKNHYLYRDTDGSGEWTFLPWDHDLTWGSNWVGTSFSDVIYADVDEISFGPKSPHDPSVIHPSHPFINSSRYREWNNNWNRLMDPLLLDPMIRQMYLRRLRTAMDNLIGEPGTTDSWVDTRLNEFLATMGPDTDLDKQVWANPKWAWGEDQTFEQAIEIIRNEYLEVRRQYLYVTHGIDNLVPEEITVLVPEFTSSRYFVPSDDALDTRWTATDFDDTSWADGETGLGFENRPRFFDQLINTRVKPTETAADSTSIFVRIPFEIDDLSQIEELTLRMKYDDGFVAYLNGEEVSRANIRTDDTPTYDAKAKSRNPNAAGARFQNFLITKHIGKLVTGTNVLAIHVLNSSAGNSDMLVLPELIEGIIQTVEVAGIPHAQAGNPSIVLDPSDWDVSPESGNQDEEYIRLNNPTDQAVDISGWRIDGGVQHTFREGTVIPAGSSLFVSPDVAAFRGRATGPSGGQGLLVQGNYKGHLANRGEVVHLIAADGEQMDSLELPDTPTDAQRFLRVTEVNYNPIILDELTEFVELTNTNRSQTLDVSGVTWVAGPQTPYALPPGTQLAAGQSLVITKSPAAFLAAYPGVPASQVFGPFVGNLSNQGEQLKFDDSLGNTIVDFRYSDNQIWPQSPDGVGASLELIDPLTPTEELSKYYRWRGSVSVDGTPTVPVEDPVGVVINEVVSNPRGGQTDAIELFNVSTSTVDLSGWSLSNSKANFRKFQFPAGTTLSAGAYLTLNEQQLGFKLDGTDNDDVWLVRTDAAGRPLQFGDDVQFAASVVGESWGRLPNGEGRLGPLTSPNLNRENLNPRVGPVVMGEVQYNPGSPSPAALAIDPNLDADDLEFVEINNIAGTPLDLTGWRLRGGIDFEFDNQTTIAVNASLVVISFNPNKPENAARIAAFRAHYGLDESIKLVGGFGGRLSNSDDRVQLQRPGGTEANPNASDPLWVDEVLYDDLPSWPVKADGTGASLQRVSESSYGNFDTSWYAAQPTPGEPSFGGPRGDFNGDGIIDVVDVDLLYDQIISPTPDLSFDLTGDGLVDIDDRDEMIVNVVGTNFGDANLDKIFNSSDLVLVFASGKYEDGIPLNATWAEGNWNADGDFGSGDVVLALATGGYVPTALRRATPLLHPALASAATDAVFQPRPLRQKSADESSPWESNNRVSMHHNPHPRTDVIVRALDSLFDDDGSPMVRQRAADDELLDEESIGGMFPFQ